MKTPYEQSEESFNKHVEKAEDEKKKIVGIILTICFASIGFSVSQLTKSDFKFVGDLDINLTFCGIIGLALTVILLIAYRIFLYLSFSQMANYYSAQMTGANFKHRNWVYQMRLWFLPLSIGIFILSEASLLIGFMVRIFFVCP